MMLHHFALIMFGLIFLFVLSGYPVALVLGGISTLFGLYFFGPDFFLLLPSRMLGVFSNYVLLAVPLFVFMGVVLEKSGMAKKLLESLAGLFGRASGGLAVSTLFVGTLLAASTGIVGATVITMGLISLPVMLKNEYHPKVATGTILASGTLGQIIPPSIVLVLLGSVMQLSVGKLFAAAIIPSVLLVGGYLIYILVLVFFSPKSMPPIQREDDVQSVSLKELVESLIPPILLIILVLGAIFSGIASPTEAAGIGAFGALVLAYAKKSFSIEKLKKSMYETAHVTAMVFFILLGATTFSLVFRGMEGDTFLSSFVTQAVPSPTMFLILVMLLLFVAGFFIDFIEIIFIFIPVVQPIFQLYGFDMTWIAILLALNLQTSFLTPPFGFALFYLRGVAPPSVKTTDLYKGVVPFLIIQLLVLIIIVLWPNLIS